MDGHPSRPPVPRRLERRTRSLGGPRQRDLLRLAPDGVWRAIASPRCWWALTPPFHPYRAWPGGLLSVPLSVGFRRLGFPQRPCPLVSGLSSDDRGRPRPSGLLSNCTSPAVHARVAAPDGECSTGARARGGHVLRRGPYGRARGIGAGQHHLRHRPTVGQQRATFRAGEHAAESHDELTAAEALQARATGERQQLLVERPRERCDDGAHRRLRNTPTTFPRICTWSA